MRSWLYLCILILSGIALGKTITSATTVDVDIKTKLDREALSQFVGTQDDSKAKFFMQDGKTVIFSKNPIKLPKPNIYQPKSLAVFGIKMDNLNFKTDESRYYHFDISQYQIDADILETTHES